MIVAGWGVELRFRMPSVQKKKKGFSGPEFEALRWAAAWPRLLVSWWPRRARSPASCAVPSAYFRPSTPVGRRECSLPTGREPQT